MSEKDINKEEINQAAAEAIKVVSSAAEEAAKVIANSAADAIKVAHNSGGNNLLKQISLWTGVGGFVGMIIMGYLFLANPTRDNDTALQLQAQRIESQQKTIDSITKTQQNDTQEVKAAVKDLEIQLQIYSNEIIKLQTVIEERIPKTK